MGIPVQKRWSLIRKGRMDEAVNLALTYTPFPATVCGYLCPSPCMQSCTRQIASFPSLDVAALGRASLEAAAPSPAPSTGKTVGVIGGGPAGLSVAWQLWMRAFPGHSRDPERPGGENHRQHSETRIPKKCRDTNGSRPGKIEHIF